MNISVPKPLWMPVDSKYHQHLQNNQFNKFTKSICMKDMIAINGVSGKELFILLYEEGCMLDQLYPHFKIGIPMNYLSIPVNPNIPFYKEGETWNDWNIRVIGKGVGAKYDVINSIVYFPITPDKYNHKTFGKYIDLIKQDSNITLTLDVLC